MVKKAKETGKLKRNVQLKIELWGYQNKVMLLHREKIINLGTGDILTYEVSPLVKMERDNEGGTIGSITLDKIVFDIGVL